MRTSKKVRHRGRFLVLNEKHGNPITEPSPDWSLEGWLRLSEKKGVHKALARF